jgi:hypothetical protein
MVRQMSPSNRTRCPIEFPSGQNFLAKLSLTMMDSRGSASVNARPARK